MGQAIKIQGDDLMSGILVFILFLAVVAIVMMYIINSRKKDLAIEGHSDFSKRKCDKCGHEIPDGYMKSLCPQCKTFLAR